MTIRSQAAPLLLLLPLSAACYRPVIGYHDGESILVDTGTVDMEGNRVPVECPNISAVEREGIGSEAVHDSTVDAQLAGDIRDIPEYHDCQRLVTVPRPGLFGPLVAIFAREALELVDEEDFAAPGGTPVVQIYNFSSIPYGPLGIQTRYSCLYLKRVGSQWEARIRHQGSSSACPDLTAREWLAAGPLTARQVKPSDNPAHYPPVARWDTDPRNGHHYIGVKCLDGWCEIGVGNFTSSGSYSGPDYTGVVKGWYDEQRLAERVVPKVLVPRISARIVPVAGLDQLTMQSFTCADPCPRDRGWVRVATVFIEGASKVYRDSMNFTPGADGNAVFLRRKTRGTQELWQTRIVNTDGDTTYHRTLRVAHSPSDHVPATARWHWRESDETTWVRCVYGCCESSSKKVNPDVW